jgi:signal transduction histidine kinase
MLWLNKSMSLIASRGQYLTMPPTLFCILDEKLNISSINPAIQNYDYDADALEGRQMSALMPQGDLEQFKQSLLTVKREGLPANIKTQLSDAGGKPFGFDCSAHWSDSERSYFCVFHDMTTIRQAERLKADVVAMVTHDLRAPLNSIMHFQEMLEEGFFGDINEKGQRLLKLAEQSSSTMQTLISDLLDLEKIASGRLELAKRQLPISEIISRAIGTVQLMADENAVKIVTHQVQATVEVDSDRICQVVTNLLSNAIKFSPRQSQIDVDVAVDAGRVRVSVIDRGPGIAEAEQSAIFDRFQQGKSDKAHLGSGLGLSICKALVTLHKGNIWVESELGKGSAFSFSLPL